ncbi:MAG: hypothetical protein IT359_20490 [Gemmatimonadaceae bacterium]|nr:hypothetical protein [Gemmatimonadaceae bacterium]
MMSRVLARALAALALGVVVARAAHAQRPWNDSTSRLLVERATERRARQLADSGLADYTAQAHGFLTFLAQVGDGFPIPPKVVKADELMLEVYWRAPNYSKQWIVGRRDTLLLPTDINYHRDHLGIVQNNFPDIIRLGDGDEVQDVAHPLSARGLATYGYQLSDSLRLEIPGRTIDVYEVKIRPRNEREAAAVGAVYIAKDDAQVVRMAFSFTRTALKDQQLEDVSIVLENSLIEGRFWLPRRQEIEIRRTGSWMDFPARGIIRGRWDIRDYRVNSGTEAQVIAASPGPEILYAPSDRRKRFRWPDSSNVILGLPDDIAVATDDDVRQVQEEARRLVRSQALQRTQSTLPSVRSMSDIARVTRAEGLAIGGGIRRRLGSGIDIGAVGRFALSDHEPKATISLGWERADGVAARLSAFREYREAGDEPETSRVRNSIAAQEFGSDYTQPFDTRGATLALHLGTHAGMRLRLDGGYEWQQAVRVAARPSFGTYEPTLAAVRGEGPRFALAVERPLGAWWWGGTFRFRGELRAGRLGGWTGGEGEDTLTTRGYARAYAMAEWMRESGRSQWLVRATGGAVDAQGGVAPQLLLFAGGPQSGPGYAFHQFRSRALATQHVEWRTPIPFVSLSLGRWGRVPSQARLAPFVHNVVSVEGNGGTWYLPAGALTQPPANGAGSFPSVGVGLLTFFDLVRVDVARGLRRGRWTLGVDVSRDFWSIL